MSAWKRANSRELVTPGKKRNVKFVVAYDGTQYCGWQVQKSGQTIQGTIEKALERILGTPTKIIGSGRTDAGVHASGQVANCRPEKDILPGDLLRALNALLPADIRLLQATEVTFDFHAQKQAVEKEYVYRIYTGKVLPPFLRYTFHHEKYPMDFHGMQEGAGYFLGPHEFTSFCSAGASVKNKTRTVTVSRLTRRGHRVVYRIRANGFLWHMVRNIVGTLLEIGQGRMAARDIPVILKKKDRAMSGPTAPPRGLMLTRVFYPG